MSIFFQQKILTGLFGGEGFIMQKLEGDGFTFLHAGGTVVERSLSHGETLHVDTGCVVAFELSVGFDVERVGGVKTMLFGGEGMFFARLKGPGPGGCGCSRCRSRGSRGACWRRRRSAEARRKVRCSAVWGWATSEVAAQVISRSSMCCTSHSNQ